MNIGRKTNPPYIENGDSLYLNDYGLADHRRISEKILRLKQPWVVTYDRAAVKFKLYPDQRRMTYDLSYSAQSRYQGREVMFFADQLKLPPTWQKSKKITLSPPTSEYPVFGRLS